MKLGIHSVFVEGGKKTIEAFINSNLWDEARIIEGKTEFSTGVLAPTINAIPFKTQTFSSDTIFFYKNV
jgi:diaminohydroxyphosphoribosylaminopyrimidine deaminase / 5-amino-6-(5-phosphoribosylamino)uracil reductase